jgi:type IV secretory pathway TrbD component
MLPKALWKPQLLMGCERIPWIMAAMISGVIIMAAQTWALRISGLVFGLLLIFLIRMINKKEPFAFKIAFRYGVFQKYYLNVAKYPSISYRLNNLDQ